jgi:hypothetical protein
MRTAMFLGSSVIACAFRHKSAKILLPHCRTVWGRGRGRGRGRGGDGDEEGNEDEDMRMERRGACMDGCEKGVQVRF